ncbi:MAG TPA: NAD(P)-binding protein [Verrucomicrobiae bacterium]|nr:NAD(P)-binding protein [Verrucomicrobiae bacterium]
MSDTSDQHPSHYVIGSGPSGMACAHALLQRGAKVVMLDAGITLEEARRKTVRQMSSRPPKKWSKEQLDVLKSGMAAGIKGIPLKLIYGSDYPYRETDIHIPADYQEVGLQPSLGLGGFSAVWGAAMMPYSENDMAGWPISQGDLAQHYAAVAKLTGLSGVHDDLEKIFPLHAAQPDALAMSTQARNFYAQLGKNRAPLQAAGIYFGQSRVAVKAGPKGCVYCGLCMYGCPYGYIYNSEQTLQELKQNPNFTYRADAIVTRLREDGDIVHITGYRRTGREPFDISAPRVYLATGVLATARIVLRSLALYDQPVRLKDSQYYLFPLVTKSGGDVQNESLHTLSQMFVEIFDKKVTPRSAHLQVYSYNELIGEAVRQPFGPLAPMMEWLACALEKRLLVVQGYLHSDHSSQIAIRLKKGDPDRLQVQAELNPEVRPTIHRVLRKLRRHARQLNAWPLAPMLQVADPGRGFHSGGSFPMRANPAGLETDILGRLPGWRRIHLVDASVLPDIPATQITFSVMANAHRIASQTAEK